MTDKSPIEFNYKKATQALNYFARKNQNESIDKLKVIKLMWLADRYHIRKYGRPITGDIYFAMPLGPVGSTVKDISELCVFLSEEERDYASRYLQAINNTTVKSVRDIDRSVFSESDLEALEFVHNNYSNFDQSDLVELSHKYPEWAKFKSELESKNTSRQLMSYLDFFGNPTNITEDKFAEDQELLDDNKSIVEESIAITEAMK
jgi:uncharacterized phage-associated protein